MNIRTDKRAAISRFIRRCEDAVPWLLSAAAIFIAIEISHVPLFERISFVISDAISRSTGIGGAGHVVLVRLDQSLSKQQLQTLLAGAIPSLISDYGASTVGVDIDFSEGGYKELANSFAAWSQSNPHLSDKIVWAVGYVPGPRPLVAPKECPKVQICDDCSGLTCKDRYIPKSVFGSDYNPPNYALAVAFPSVDCVSRSSARFVCHSQTVARVTAFHFMLVEIYCQGRTDIATCRELQPNKQAETNLYAWYESSPLDLCNLVSCQDASMGTPLKRSTELLSDKIVILYSDVPSDDEHPTPVGSSKGAEIVASLVENELQFGVAQVWRVWLMKWALECIATALLIFLFHWRYTESWAILLAIGVFVLYVHFVPRLVTWVPDFRNYVLAVILTFWIEVLLKSAWSSIWASKSLASKSSGTSEKEPPVVERTGHPSGPDLPPTARAKS
jgi:hypothetical protein